MGRKLQQIVPGRDTSNKVLAVQQLKCREGRLEQNEPNRNQSYGRIFSCLAFLVTVIFDERGYISYYFCESYQNGGGIQLNQLSKELQII